MTAITIIMALFLVFTVHHNEEMNAFSIQMDPFLVFTVHHKEECTQMRKLQTLQLYWPPF